MCKVISFELSIFIVYLLILGIFLLKSSNISNELKRNLKIQRHSHMKCEDIRAGFAHIVMYIIVVIDEDGSFLQVFGFSAFHISHAHVDVDGLQISTHVLSWGRVVNPYAQTATEAVGKGEIAEIFSTGNVFAWIVLVFYTCLGKEIIKA